MSGEEAIAYCQTNNINVDNVLRRYDDLLIQAMIFDMDIDIQTWSLTEKRTDSTPYWLKKWKEKENDSDTRAYDFEH